MLTILMRDVDRMDTLLESPNLIERVRRDTRRRHLLVTDVERMTPRMQRISFRSRDLDDFESAAPDDHIKLFIPLSKHGDAYTDDVCMRDYTPRKFDPATKTLIIDFALHEAGRATAWALQACPGDTLEIGGPRKSTIVADDFDWYLLIGDETALPSIGRRVEELRPGVRVLTVVVVETFAERQTFATSAIWTPLWIARDGRSASDDALMRLALADHEVPAGDGYIWIAGEASVARSLRNLVSETWGHPREWTKSSGYWVRDKAGAYE
jgi:NADPH-dependent ferric siderophore reductase